MIEPQLHQFQAGDWCLITHSQNPEIRNKLFKVLGVKRHCVIIDISSHVDAKTYYKRCKRTNRSRHEMYRDYIRYIAPDDLIKTFSDEQKYIVKDLISI